MGARRLYPLRMRIHGTPWGGNPRRVAIFLAEKGLEIPFVDVDLMGGAQHSEAFRALNPFEQVPVLELDDGTCISETLAICRYLEELHPEPALFGSDPLERAQVEMWQRRVEFNLYGPVRELVRHTVPVLRTLEPVQIPEWGELNRGRIERALRLIDRQLADQPFIAGRRYSVADITALFTLDGTGRLGGVAIPPACAHLTRWYEQVAARPSTTATRPPGQRPG
jgi:glutathione S-transferase